MRRCFEQLPSRSQLCSHPIAPRLSFFRAGSSQISFVPKLPSYIPPLPATRKSLSYSFRNRRQDAPSPAPQDVSASTQARSTRKSKAIRKKHINTARPSQRSPEEWVAEVERFLPRRLSRPDDLESRAVIPPDVDVEDVLRTLTSARNQSDVDILGFLALNQRRFKAVVGLVEILLKAVALAANEPFKDELPSNIDWPHGSFAKRDGTPIELERPLHVSRRPLGSSRQPFDFALSEKSQEIAMELIWSLLADLVLASANRPSDEGKQIMNTVHQILALIHNLGLVPPTIYTYCLPQDWDQRTRRGDLQSQGEGYHGEQLAVDTPRKFISAEVVLAIADCLINNLNVSVTDGEVPVTEIQDDIKELISFAEPHGLAPAYFDYLAVRLLQTESMYDMDKANSLRKLASTISQLRAMHYVEGTHLQSSGLDFDSILDHSEVHAGILHQGLQACIEANLVTKAIDTFTEIQKMVDGNKLEAIGEFLSLSLSPEDGFFTSRHAKGRGEFLNTYGQLPIYKLPPFLDLVSNAGLFGLGDWLLFSEDIDGAILPPSTWAKRSVTAAVTRYASAKNDPILIKRIYSLTKRSGRKLTVNVLRALVVYHVNACDWTSAVLNLRDLRRAEGGGYSPRIVASLAAKILALEVDPAVMRQEDAESDLSQAMLLLCNILDGIYDSPAASFRIAQKRTFGQQVGYLLRLLENVADGELAETATRFKSRFPVSNEPNLATDTFNVLFSAIVETRGVLEGRNIWHLFCKDPRDYPSSLLLVGGHDSTSDDHTTDKDEDKFFEGETNDARNDVVGLGEPDKDYLGSRMSTVDSPQISDAIQHAGSQIPVASPASLNINSALPLDDLDLAGNPSSSTSDVESEDTDIPVEMVGMDMDSAPPLLNPIVVPNMRTLQIIVRGALSEIQDRKERKRGHTDLDAILKWAEQFYGAFNLAREDIETELRISESLPGKLRIATKHRRAVYGLPREKFKLDVGKLFTKGVFVPRRPGPQQPGQETTPSNGTDDMTEVAVNTTEGEAEDGGEQIELPSRPTFKVRKFATSVQHA
ncbi:hypothetical protein CLAIMM_07075 [Cladophialophora immunda]|nr:hypothetical protein CLAIMM_07075 [Cladophialophora immunda]